MKPNLAEKPDPQYPMTFPKYASPKLDGIRGLCQASTMLTRTLKLVPNEALRDIYSPYQGLDGELIYGEPTAKDVYSKSYSAVMTIDGSPDGVTFYVFDLLDKTRPYEDRLKMLQDMNLPPSIKVLPQTLVSDQAELDNFYAHNLEVGYEGAILRNPSAMYKEGRATAKSQDMLKLKPFVDAEATVVAVFEAMENQNVAFINELGHTDRSSHRENKVGKGMVGGFTVSMGGVTFNIGAGKLTHPERIALWQNPQACVGKVCTFRYLPIGVKDAPRHGRFYRWRGPLDAT